MISDHPSTGSAGRTGGLYLDADDSLERCDSQDWLTALASHVVTERQLKCQAISFHPSVRPDFPQVPNRPESDSIHHMLTSKGLQM